MSSKNLRSSDTKGGSDKEKSRRSEAKGGKGSEKADRQSVRERDSKRSKSDAHAPIIRTKSDKSMKSERSERKRRKSRSQDMKDDDKKKKKKGKSRGNKSLLEKIALNFGFYIGYVELSDPRAKEVRQLTSIILIVLKLP
jgi:hypothetical protein